MVGHRFQTIGIYVLPPAERSPLYAFYKDCGYNYLEFCEGGFGYRPDRLPDYWGGLASAIAQAKRQGFTVWILLLAGMKQWMGPEEYGNPGTFSALDAPLLDTRLEYIRQAVRALRQADGFQFFAGDPGGDPQGRSTVQDCIAFSRRVHAIVREEAPRAAFAINLWAIAEWAGFPSPFKLTFWKQQVALSRALVDEPDLLGPDCGVLFSLDNYYRSLTLRCYEAGKEQPDLYPRPDDIAALRSRRVTPVVGWPYFLVDECDDGFITPNNVATKGQAGAETRYISRIIETGRTLALDGLIANASYPEAEALNIFTFGRMCRDASLTPVRALEAFAAQLAEPASVRDLLPVLQFIENHSNWQASLPVRARLRNFGLVQLPDSGAALEQLARVKPRSHPGITLPESPERYLQRLRGRLEAIARGEIGGVKPHFGA